MKRDDRNKKLLNIFITLTSYFLLNVILRKTGVSNPGKPLLRIVILLPE